MEKRRQGNTTEQRKEKAQTHDTTPLKRLGKGVTAQSSHIRNHRKEGDGPSGQIRYTPTQDVNAARRTVKSAPKDANDTRVHYVVED